LQKIIWIQDSKEVNEGFFGYKIIIFLMLKGFNCEIRYNSLKRFKKSWNIIGCLSRNLSCTECNLKLEDSK